MLFDCLIREDLRQSKKAEEVEERKRRRRRMTMTVEERLAEDIKVEMRTEITRHRHSRHEHIRHGNHQKQTHQIFPQNDIVSQSTSSSPCLATMRIMSLMSLT